jgi:hypothetical protein
LIKSCTRHDIILANDELFPSFFDSPVRSTKSKRWIS